MMNQMMQKRGHDAGKRSNCRCLNAISTEQRPTRPSSLAAIRVATLTDSSWASSRPHLKVNFAPWKTAKEAR